MNAQAEEKGLDSADEGFNYWRVAKMSRFKKMSYE